MPVVLALAAILLGASVIAAIRNHPEADRKTAYCLRVPPAEN
jgi:hypothetical protein